MNILVKIIPIAEMRYPTLGDYYVDPKDRNLTIICLPEELHEPARSALLVHELVEMKLCLQHGISFESIDEWDKWFEVNGEGDEPGEDPRAPYFKEHAVASQIESLFLANTGLDLSEYCKLWDGCIAILDGLVAKGHWDHVLKAPDR